MSNFKAVITSNYSIIIIYLNVRIGNISQCFGENQTGHWENCRVNGIGNGSEIRPQIGPRKIPGGPRFEPYNRRIVSLSKTL